MKITLRQLQYFDALARERHFGRAAGRASVTQPALSAQIRQLETSIGAPLVDRAPRGLTLTPLGRSVAERAKAILDAVAEIEAMGAVAGAPLRIGLIPTLAPYLVPAFLARVRVRGLQMAISEGLTARLLEQIRAGDLDGAVIALPSADAALAERALFEDLFLLAMPPVEPGNAAIPPARPEEIDPSRLLLLDEGHCLADQVLAACNLHRDSVAQSLGAISLATVSRLVASGQGITLIPEIATGFEGRGVRLHRFTEPQPGRTIGLVTRRGMAEAGWVAQVAALLVEARDAADNSAPSNTDGLNRRQV